VGRVDFGESDMARKEDAATSLTSAEMS